MNHKTINKNYRQTIQNYGPHEDISYKNNVVIIFVSNSFYLLSLSMYIGFIFQFQINY
jgi:hypothetical protein